MIAIALAVALLAPLPTPTAPAERLAVGYMIGEPEFTAPIPGDCDTYHDTAIAAGWTEQQWPTVRYIIRRESHCYPAVVNRYGCTGLSQVCRGNFARMGVTRADLQDALTNLTVARRLCQEWVDVGRSCWRPWWLGRWRP